MLVFNYFGEPWGLAVNRVGCLAVSIALCTIYAAVCRNLWKLRKGAFHQNKITEKVLPLVWNTDNPNDGM